MRTYIFMRLVIRITGKLILLLRLVWLLLQSIMRKTEKIWSLKGSKKVQLTKRNTKQLLCSVCVYVYVLSLVQAMRLYNFRWYLAAVPFVYMYQLHTVKYQNTYRLNELAPLKYRKFIHVA